MPLGHMETSLWKAAFENCVSESCREPQERLRSAYRLFRERAVMLSREIPRDLPEYTVHDESHFDALWELADMIAGPELSLTPTEGFVLGGAFLIHDLGMGLAAWPGGADSLASEPEWPDILASAISELYDTALPLDYIQNPPADAFELAKERALRERHAAQAANLPLISWPGKDGGSLYHLIEDQELRETFGHLIGQIAASHWWNIDVVADKFPGTRHGAPVSFPDEWTVDSLKLACLLRLADAAHLDARRAPGFLRALRRPTRVSDSHWEFQGRLLRARPEGDRLVYTAHSPFPEAEAAAWWLCFDSLQMVDRELHAVDALLVDRGLRRMAIHSVKGADSPSRLKTLIPTEGWLPVDAHLTVSNVPALARKLGGESLYGNHPEVALRELIQNACDATNALFSLTGAPKQAITVRVRQIEGVWWLDVIDLGIGMSQQVMTGPLLDFGRSYWGTELMRKESPGLAASGFRSIGRYGIGFYAAFMLGDYVRVISRRFNEASVDTRVLEFPAGLDERPIIRSARSTEVRYMGGTQVSIRLRQSPYSQDGLLSHTKVHGPSIFKLCRHLAPGSPVDIDAIDEAGQKEKIITADDWKTLPNDSLVRRLCVESTNYNEFFGTPLDFVANAVRRIELDNGVIARLSLAPSSSIIHTPDKRILFPNGVLMSEGLRIESINGVVGVAMGSPVKADRGEGSVSGTPKLYQRWASEQADIWRDDINKHFADWFDRVTFLAYLGASLEQIHVCVSAQGYLCLSDFRDIAKNFPDIVIASGFEFDATETDDGFRVWSRHLHQQVELDKNVVIVPEEDFFVDRTIWGEQSRDKRWQEEAIRSQRGDEFTPKAWWHYNQRSVEALVLGAVFDAWSCDLDSGIELVSRSNSVTREIRVGTFTESRQESVAFEWMRVSRPATP